MTRIALSLGALLSLLAGPAPEVGTSVFTGFEDARPVVEAMREALPSGLAGLGGGKTTGSA